MGVKTSFMFRNIIIGSENKCSSEHLRRSKQKMSTGKKTTEEKQTFLLESMQFFGKIFYCICICFIMRDIQSHSITWLSRNDLESECLSQVAKTRKYSIFGTNNFPKIRAYAVLNTLSRTVTLKFLD